MPTVDVWCPTCNHLDSRWLLRGNSIASLTCAECGDAVPSPRARAARESLAAGVFKRNVELVRLAVAGDLEIDQAAEYARYAAHTAFKLKLVPYGPEPNR